MVAPRRRSFTITHAAAVIALVAVAARWVVFGNPLVHVDEEFYLLVGHRMLHGAIPYVDVWDRKPVGLFLIFAGTSLFGGEGVLQYQIAALAFVIATALVVFAIARRIASPTAALGSALLYVFYLNLAGGEGGQAPVWYNLPVAAAIAVIFFARTPGRRLTGDFRKPGVIAMLLFGIAMQIKYTAVFEGLFAGTMLIALSWRGRRPPRSMLIDIILWVACALLPTIMAGAFYAHIGHFHEWFFANFVSILNRHAEPLSIVHGRMAQMAMLVVPLAFAKPMRGWLSASPADPGRREDLCFVDAWAASAILGVVIFGTWFNHYALPLFAPLAIMVAPLAGSPRGRIYFALLLAASAFWGQHMLHRHRLMRGDAALLEKLTIAVRGHRNCIFVYDGPMGLYDRTNSCLPTPHMFTAHLSGLIERDATGIDQAKLVGAIMARRPDRVTSVEPAFANENPLARAALYRVLRTDYTRMIDFRRGDRTTVVYGLKGTIAPIRRGAGSAL